MTGKGGDYEGWVLRLIDEPEDILFALNSIDWLRFAGQQIEDANDIPVTKAQADALEEQRMNIALLPLELDFRLRSETRYRDAKGRWTKDTAATPVPRIVYRGEGERFITRGKAKGILDRHISDSGVRKKSRSEVDK